MAPFKAPKKRGIVVVDENNTNQDPVAYVPLRSRWSLVEAGNEIDKARAADVPRYYRFLKSSGDVVSDVEELEVRVRDCLRPQATPQPSSGCLCIQVADIPSSRPGSKLVEFLLGDTTDELGLAMTVVGAVEAASEVLPFLRVLHGVCKRIIDQVKARRDLSNDIVDATRFLKEVGSDIAEVASAARDTGELKKVNWKYLEGLTTEMNELIEDILKRDMAGSWWNAKQDLATLGSIQGKMQKEMTAKNFKFMISVSEKVSNHEERIDSLARRMSCLEVKEVTLESILHPLREADDKLIEEHMERFVQGTREWALQAFDEWISDDRQEHRIFVLTGNAGVGKTAIMSKLARERSEVVVAYHFCRHDDSQRRNPKSMILSLAHQLSHLFEDYKDDLRTILKERGVTRADLMGEDYNVVSLFSILLEVPLGKLNRENAAVILIDALDECEHEGRNSILDCIRQNFIKLPSWVRIYITTRPEIPITNKLKKFNPKELEPTEENNLNDLQVFFRQLLDEYGSEEVQRSGNLGSTVEELVTKSGGLFIYAAFVADMIHSKGKGNTTQEDLDQFTNK